MKTWSNLLELLDHELGVSTVDRWLRTLKILKFDARNLYLDAANTFQLNWFKEHVSPLLSKHFLTSSGKPIKIHFSIEGKPLQQEKKGQVEVTENFAPNPLESHAVFDGFVTGEDENLAHKILLELIDSTIEMGSYNPIYLYGHKGCGKSHLLMATAHALEEQGTKCFYVRCERFTEHIIRAFRSGLLQEFRKTYRTIDVLLIDDVHLFSRKTATQEELFHTFNHLYIDSRSVGLEPER